MTSVDELLTTAQSDVESGEVPACQVAVARDGEIVAFETFGDATDTTRFCIFSATKPFVASAIWLLMADGLVDVSRPVCDYIPEFARNGKEVVTIEQVMLHTAGFPNAPMSNAAGSDAHRRRAQFEQWKLEWEPGTRFEYHPTVAHWVLADLIERVSGDDFRDFVEHRVCTPLGLPRLLGLPLDAQSDIAPLTPVGDGPPDAMTFEFNDPAVRSAGNPGGGAFMVADRSRARLSGPAPQSRRAVGRGDPPRCEDQHPVHVQGSAAERGGQSHARPRDRGRRRHARPALRDLRRPQLARILRPRRRARGGRLGRPRDRHLVRVPQQRNDQRHDRAGIRANGLSNIAAALEL